MEQQERETGATTHRAEPTDARLGRIIGSGYTLVSVAGRGGMATVYAARTREGRDVAVKIQHAELRGTPGIEQGFMREAAVMRSIRHEGVLRVFEEGVTKDGDPFFVMELLDGMSLLEFLAQHEGRLGLQEALLIGVQLLEILQSVHEQGVVHRDVKPANLFLMKSGTVKLLDFGVAMLPGDEHDEEEGSRLGTPAYMPPEQAMNAARGVDARSDLFAAGATLYLLLSGEKLRDAPTAEEIFVLAATTQPRSLARAAPDLPIGVIRAVDRALAWNPGDRFASAREMQVELSEFLHEGGLDDEEQRRIRQESLRSVLIKALAAGAATLEEQLFGRRTMREYMRPLASVLVAVARQGWDGPETEEKFRILHEETQRTGRALGTGVIMTVRPHSFEYLGECIWEPTPPLNDIPYVLFLGGFRTIRILPDIPREELMSFVNLLLLDPVRDLSPEDDLGSIFLETGYPNIDTELITSFDMTLLDEASNLDEQLAEVRAVIDARLDEERQTVEEATQMAGVFGARSVVEARAIEVRIESSGDGASSKQSIDLARIENAISEHLGHSVSRAARVLQAAVRDAFAEGDQDLILDPLREMVDALALARRLPEIVGLVEMLLRAVSADDVPTLLQSIVQLRAVRRLVEEADSPIEFEGRIYRVLEMPSFPEIISHLAAPHFEPLVLLLADDPTSKVCQLLGALLSQHTAGNEEFIGEQLQTAPPEACAPLVQGLLAHPTSAALLALRKGAANGNDRVRFMTMKGRVHLRDPSISEDFDRIARSGLPEVRVAALKLVRSARLSGVANLLAAIANEERFHALPLQERQILLTTLLEVHATTGEHVCMELIRPDALLREASHESTRELSAQLLGSLSRSPRILEFLEAESKRFVRHTREFRTTLTASAEQIRSRLRHGQSR